MAYVGRDFSPAETSESQEFGLDFVHDLKDGEVLISAVWELTVREGSDPTPQDHLIDAANVVTPPGTFVASATTQRIGGLLPNVTYTARAVAETSLGNTLSLWSHIRGEPVE